MTEQKKESAYEVVKPLIMCLFPRPSCIMVISQPSITECNELPPMATSNNEGQLESQWPCPTMRISHLRSHRQLFPPNSWVAFVRILQYGEKLFCFFVQFSVIVFGATYFSCIKGKKLSISLNREGYYFLIQKKGRNGGNYYFHF